MDMETIQPFKTVNDLIKELTEDNLTEGETNG